MNRRIAVLVTAVFASTALVTGTASAASWHTIETFPNFSACNLYKAWYDGAIGGTTRCIDSSQGVRFQVKS